MTCESERCVVTLLRDPLHKERGRETLPCAPGQWLHEVVPDGCLTGEWVAVDGGRVIPREEWDQYLLVPNAEILLYPRLTGGDTLKIVTGIVFPPLGVYWGLRAAGLPTWAAGLLSGGPLGFGFTAIENIMAGKPTPANTPSTSSALASSPTYGFGGIQNNTRIGAPIPVVYGWHRVGGQILNTFVETRNDSDVLHLLIGISEGEVTSISGIEINGQSISNYVDVSYQTRNGTNVQSAVGLFGDKTATTYSAEGQLTTSFITYTTQGENLNGFVVKLTFPGGLFTVHSSGSLVMASVSIEVDYKLHSAGTWTTGPRQTIGDNKRAVMRRQIRVDGLAAGQYDVRVRRTTVESVTSTTVDAVVREAVTELINDGYTYPNTAILSVEAVATNQLSGGIPRVTALVFGVKVRRFFNTLAYVVEWTQSPAWIVFDMLTNPRYGHGQFTWRVLRTGTGLNVTNGSVNFSGTATGWTASTLRRGDVLHDPVGQAVGVVKTINYGTQSGTFEQDWGGPTASNRAYEVRSNDLDILSFVFWGGFCADFVEDGNGGTETRALCSMVFDAEREDIWSAVLRVCGIGQASAVKIGNYIRIKIEQQADPVQLFTMANIKADSFEEVFLSLKDRANIFEVQFLNEHNEFQQDMAVLEDPLIFSNSEQPRRKTISAYGLTRSSHAARLARFNQRVNRFVTRTITFEVGLDAVACEPGDVIRFQHDIPQWGFGGRAASGSTSTIVLDRSVTIESGKSYEVLIRHDNDSVETKTVTTSPGTVTTLTISGAWSQTPTKGEVWAFGELLISTKPFRVITLARTQDLDARITAVEYSDAVYDETGLTAANQVQYSSLGDLVGPPGQVKNLTLLEIDGIEQSVWVSFTPPGSANFKTANIYRIDGGAKNLLGQSATGAFPVTGLRGGEVFTVKVTSVSSLGGESNYASAPVAGLVVSQVNPPDVPLLVLEGDRLRWNYPNPPRDLAGFLVRFRPGTSNGWESATAAHDNILLTTDLQIFRRSGVQTYLVKAVDKFGNESVHAKSLTVSFDADETDNIVFTQDHAAAGWPGTLTGGTIVGNEIQADALALFWSGNDAALFWSGNDAALFWSAVYGSMVYEFTIMPDADTLDAMLKLQLTMQGEWSVEYQPDSTALMWDADSTQPMWSTDSAAMWDELGGYTQWPGQLDHLRQQPYNIRITGHAGTVQAVLQQLTVLLDVPDLIEILEDVPLLAGGSRLSLARNYRRIVAVRWSLQESGGSAAYIKVIDKSVAGPLLQGFTTGGVGTAAVVDVVVHGY